MCPRISASWRIWLNLCFLPPMWQIDWFRHFCTAHGSVVGYNGATWRLQSKLCTLVPSGEYDWTRASLGPPKCTTQMANRSVQQFLHSSRHTVPILYNGQPFSPKLALSWGSGTPSNSCFLGPIRDHNPNITTIVLAVFAQVTAECAYTLPWAPLSRKVPFPWGSGPSI